MPPADPFSKSPTRHYPLYRHSQTGWVVIYSLAAAMAVATAAIMPGPLGFPWPIAVILLAVAAFFYKLTVTVDDEKIQVVFGAGLKMRPIRIADINHVEQVEYKWWNGYGIRIGLGAIMYNISGLLAVQLVMKDGYIYRIGTDDREGLFQAIRARMEGMTERPEGR